MSGSAGVRAGRATRGHRSAATRARILDAVVASIDAVGFAGTTAQRIALEAGVSVGAVQHHFPAKADVLAAVLARSHENLSAQFAGVRFEGRDLGERVDLFVERAWRHYGSAAFRSTLEILLGAPDLAAHPAGRAAAPALAGSARRAQALWSTCFGDVAIPSARHREIRQFAFATLSGLALARRLQPAPAGVKAGVELLAASLLAAFRRALAQQP